MGVIRAGCSSAIPKMRSALVHPAAVLLGVLLDATAPSMMPATAQTSPSPAEMHGSSVPLRLALGEESTVVLEENLTTGYAWRLDKPRDEAPSCVVITDLGHEKRGGNAPAVGAAGLHRWRLRAQSAGHADLRFVYQRPWEQKPVREYLITVDVH